MWVITMVRDETGGRRRATWAGAAGIAYLALLAVAIGMIASTGLTEQALERDGFGSIARTLEGRQAVAVGSMWLFNLGHVALILFATFLIVHWGPASDSLVPGAALVMTAAALFIFETSLTIGLYQVAAPALAEGAGAGGDLEIAAEALLAVRNHTAFLAGGVLGLGALGLAGTSLRATLGPSWLGYWAFVAGIFGVVGAFTAAFEPLTYLRAPGLLLFMLWCGIVGWRFVTEGPPKADQESARVR